VMCLLIHPKARPSANRARRLSKIPETIRSFAVVAKAITSIPTSIFYAGHVLRMVTLIHLETRSHGTSEESQEIRQR
jgi:hypothetical protein